MTKSENIRKRANEMRKRLPYTTNTADIFALTWKPILLDDIANRMDLVEILNNQKE